LFFSRRSNLYFYDSVSIWPFFVGAVLLMYAGYAMVLVNRQATAQTLPSGRAPAATGQLPAIDIIVYLAGLTSKPQEIDPSLNILRQVTAGLQPGEQLSLSDEHQLIGVYHDVETYLATKEPLRSFPVPELRRMVTREFNLEPTTASRLWA